MTERYTFHLPLESEQRQANYMCKRAPSPKTISIKGFIKMPKKEKLDFQIDTCMLLMKIHVNKQVYSWEKKYPRLCSSKIRNYATIKAPVSYFVLLGSSYKFKM